MRSLYSHKSFKSLPPLNTKRLLRKRPNHSIGEYNSHSPLAAYQKGMERLQRNRANVNKLHLMKLLSNSGYALPTS